MRNPNGQVVSVGPYPQVIVDVEPLGACKRCRSGRGCGAGLLGGRPSNKNIQATAVRNLQLVRGDRVHILLEPKYILRGAVFVYGFPLIAAVLAAFIAHIAGFDDAGTSLAAVFGLAGGILTAKFRLQSINCLRDFTPTVSARLARH